MLNNLLRKLYLDLAILRLKCEFFENSYWYNSIKKETNLKILAKKRRKEMERLKEEVKSNEDDLLEGETKIFKLLTDWEY